MVFPVMFLICLAIIWLPFAIPSLRVGAVVLVLFLVFVATLYVGIDMYSARDIPELLLSIGDFWVETRLSMVVAFSLVFRLYIIIAREHGASRCATLLLTLAGLLLSPFLLLVGWLMKLDFLGSR